MVRTLIDVSRLPPTAADVSRTVRDLVGLAGGLIEPGEENDNPEYLRGMAELICDAAGLAQDEYKASVIESIAATALASRAAFRSRRTR